MLIKSAGDFFFNSVKFIKSGCCEKDIWLMMS
jgi:hypothetical protein